MQSNLSPQAFVAKWRRAELKECSDKQRPTWLDLVHRRLDQAVLDAYGWPHDLTDEQILERLLALNLERASGEGAA